MNDTHTSSVKVAQVVTDAKGTARAPFLAQATHTDEETRENNGQDGVPSPAMNTKDKTAKIERLSWDQRMKDLFQTSPSSSQHQRNDEPGTSSRPWTCMPMYTPSSAVPARNEPTDSVMAIIQENSAYMKSQVDKAAESARLGYIPLRRSSLSKSDTISMEESMEGEQKTAK